MAAVADLDTFNIQTVLGKKVKRVEATSDRAAIAIASAVLINRDQLNPGDHIYTWRTGFIYSHHGIYVGENKVIHFTGAEIASSSSGWSLSSSSSSSSGPNHCDCGLKRESWAGVYMCCLNCFLESGFLCIYEYEVDVKEVCQPLTVVIAGTKTIAPSDPSRVVIDRANYLLRHGFGDYDVVKNNCEDFALYCKTGLLVRSGGSGQVLHKLGSDIGLRGCKVRLEDVRSYKIMPEPKCLVL